MKNDLQYLKIAKIWAECSSATKLKVGAIIVKDLTIISDGYNGTPHGFPNECEDETGKTYPHVLHAETNAITKLARSTQSSEGATMFITVPPCLECAKLIIQAGIVRVVFGELWTKPKTQAGLALLQEAGVKVVYLDLAEEQLFDYVQRNQDKRL